MSKTRFVIETILTIIVCIFFVGFLGLDAFLANVLEKIFGEPNVVSKIIIPLIGILVSYFIIRRNYKRLTK
ncbi:hypothetical protein [Anaerobranca gottschalkii]|uniref:Uncharacterized protein n=1 Tax=Anaerobranca gottschalkii DSM 13577 TaxID=1120990 RepID=A0A1H9ZNX9_9FIRM|nr:hypothetical protein [Anaerobranca gottschalkii]SES83392.1 hypothetical protein SAMN03080614_101141 [Anaerobranca gottschalkii DSM 13577]